MIVILNGALGVGKTTTAWALTALFERAVMLDGDYLGAVHPFEIYDDARVEYLYRTLAHVVAFHQQHRYAAFIINYVFESPESLTQLVGMLRPLDRDIRAFWLTSAEEKLLARVTKRGGDDLAWELQRARELSAIQRRTAQRGSIGREIDTTGLGASEVAARIHALLVA